ncbi:hypothetical protein BJY00DRAFT_58483 [Aspergillus carlsbadensis]|nr:hypothetical protein BJY00DRAFT_58483 [Aspergillus carlsbadensis]
MFNKAYFTHQGAYAPNILDSLGPHAHQGIEESRLEQWETDSFLLKTTDCMSADIRRSKPYKGTMSLRICSSRAIYTAMKIHSCDDSSGLLMPTDISLY